MEHATSLAIERTDDEGETPEEWSSPLVSDPVAADAEYVPSRFSQLAARIRSRLAEVEISIPPRLAIGSVCLLLACFGVASAFSYWKQLGLQREQVIGDWIVMRSSDEAALGLSLRQDGECVIFNTSGHSWTGDFVWDERESDINGFERIAPFSTVFSQVSPSHQAGVIEPTDGYIRLQGFVKKPPNIDGQEIRDLFLRRTGDILRIGYLASVHWTDNAKRMEAGWLSATKFEDSRPDIAADLRKIDVEFPVPVEDFGGETPLHISEAIDAVRVGISKKVDNQEITVRETLTYSNLVNADYLLQRYGLPDEARRIFRFEIPALRSGPSFDGAQVVQYGELRFILTEDGQLRYLALVTEQAL